MRTLLIASSAIAMAAGCASTAPTQIGGGVYMTTKKSPACGFASAEGTLADLYIEANAFCAQQSKQLETVQAIPRDGVPFVRCASAELHFKCEPKQ